MSKRPKMSDIDNFPQDFDEGLFNEIVEMQRNDNAGFIDLGVNKLGIKTMADFLPKAQLRHFCKKMVNRKLTTLQEVMDYQPPVNYSDEVSGLSREACLHCLEMSGARVKTPDELTVDGLRARLSKRVAKLRKQDEHKELTVAVLSALTEPIVKPRGGGGGVGKKVNITDEEMLTLEEIKEAAPDLYKLASHLQGSAFEFRFKAVSPKHPKLRVQVGGNGLSFICAGVEGDKLPKDAFRRIPVKK